MKTLSARPGNIPRARLFFLLAAWMLLGAGLADPVSAASTGSPSRRPLAPPRPAAPQQQPADAQLPGFGKFHVIRIDRDGVAPREVRIERGSTVIWFNATPGYSSVIFNEGEALIRATQSPTLFFLAPDGTYVSAAFGPGAAASSAFTRAGTYSYFVTGLPLAEGNAFARVIVE